MQTKIKIRVGDLILNKESQATFLIVKLSRSRIELQQIDNKTKKITSFEMAKSRFIEQINSERGKTDLLHYPVINVKKSKKSNK